MSPRIDLDSGDPMDRGLSVAGAQSSFNLCGDSGDMSLQIDLYPGDPMDRNFLMIILKMTLNPSWFNTIFMFATNKDFKFRVVFNILIHWS